MLKIRWVGLRELRRRLFRSSQLIAPELERNLRAAGEVVIGKSRQQFRGSRTRARRRGRAVTAPGDKLAVDYGTYRRSISQDIRRLGRRNWTTEVGPTVKYAPVHELGIGRMPKRQVLTPGVEKSEREVFRIIGRTFRVVSV